MSENIRNLIEHSSLGDPSVKALSARADPAIVAKVMSRLAELEAAEKAPEAEPVIHRDSVIRRLGEALGLTSEEVETLDAVPSIYGHWESIAEEMRREYATKAAMIDLSPAALFPGDDPQSREYRRLFEDNDLAIGFDVSEGGNAYQSVIDEHVREAAAAQLRDGYGDLDAPLMPGEYVHSGHACPYDGCEWVLPVEWRHESSPNATRLRGLIERDRLCRAHLAEHEERQP